MFGIGTGPVAAGRVCNRRRLPVGRASSRHGAGGSLLFECRKRGGADTFAGVMPFTGCRAHIASALCAQYPMHRQELDVFDIGFVGGTEYRENIGGIGWFDIEPGLYLQVRRGGGGNLFRWFGLARESLPYNYERVALSCWWLG